MEFKHYEDFGGPGWTNGSFDPPGHPDTWGEARDPLDNVFRSHDTAYWYARDKYDNSPKSDADRAQFWRDTITADTNMRNDLNDMRSHGELGAPGDMMYGKAAQADAAFAAKELYNYAGLWNNRAPDDPVVSTWGPAPMPIFTTVNFFFAAAVNAVAPRDPLVLDLDGDGIEATAIYPSSPILFDQNADGTKTATGWIKADDGIVVLDLNGNGTIDSGRELFGDNTLLPNDQLASNGFQAIAQYDSDANGKIDSADAAHTQLRVWQDGNQDGVSQSSELKTLTDLGIASINVTGEVSSITLGNGNSQPWSGTFTRINGATGQSGTPELSGSLLLASNNFYREFTDDPALTPEALALPQMRGSGWARDLREAMSLSEGTAQTLKNSVAAFASATTRDAQMAQLDSVISAWGDTSGRMVHSVYKYGVDDAGSVFHTKDVVTSGDAMIILHPQGMESTTNQSTIGPVTTVTAEGAEVLRRLNVLEAFNGTKFLSLIPPASGGSTGSSTTGSSGGGVAGPPEYHATLSGTQINLINQAYDALRESVYSALVVQTRLRSYLDAIELVINDNGLSFDTAPMLAALNAHKSGDERNGLIDLIELNRYAQPTLQATGFAGIATLRSWIDGLAPSSPLRAELPALGVLLAASTGGSEVAEVYLGDAAANIFNAGGGSDIIEGGAGNDNLQGGAGDDIIDGGAGNDVIAGEYVNTFHGWYGGAGDDTYLFGRGDGQDMLYDLDGTSGNHDQIVFKAGVAPADVLVTRLNDDLVLKVSGTSDQIQISNYFAGDGAAGWAIEAIRFTDSPATFWGVSDVKLMLLTGGIGNDTLTGFASDDVITGNAGNDTLYGRGGNDTINGGAGDDLVHGDVGNDTLLGGDGNDTLMGGTSSSSNGGNGDDILDGGAGNDVLSGEMHNTFQGWFHGGGNDSYLFGRGDGQDMVYDLDGTAGNVDKIVFKAGVAPSDVQVVRSGDNLILKITGTADQIQVNNYFLSDGTSGWAMEEIRFTDAPATVWNVPDVKAMSLAGGSGNDTLTGTESADVIAGNAGNDTLYGRGGNDTINGGAGDDLVHGDVGNDTLLGGDGNDTLMGGTSSSSNGGNGDDILDGGAGNDILSGEMHNTFQGWFHGGGNDSYLFGRGDGQDMVYDLDGTAGNVDKIVFKAGVAPSDVQVVRSGDNLILKITGTADQIQVNGYFSANGTSAWMVEEIRFTSAPAMIVKYADVTTALAQGGVIQAGVTRAGGGTQQGTQYADALTANAYGAQLVGGGGNDLLAAQADGSIFDITFDGGTGDDTITGSYARDIYKFNLGDGNDTIGDDVRSNGQGVADYFAANQTADTYQDRIEFGAGITATGITRTRSGDDLVLRLNSADSITVKDWFDGTVFNKIEKVVFADGAQWAIADMEQGLVAAVGVTLTGGGPLQGTPYEDWLTANAYGTVLNGGGGNDHLATQVSGSIFDLTFNGGAGDDSMTGSYARDIYKFNLGDGHDTITDDVRSNGQGVADYFAANPAADSYQDRIEFGAGITAQGVNRQRVGDDMVLTLNGADSITLKNWFDGTVFNKIEKVVFADGTQWAVADMEQGLVPPPSGLTQTGSGTLDGTPYADALTADGYGTRLNGGAGNDQLAGQVGGSIFNLTFNGGAGDDTMTGSYGGDIYQFNLGDGHDTVTDDVRANGQGPADFFTANPGEPGYQDRIEFSAGVLAQDVARSRVGNDMVLTVSGADSITVKNWFDGTILNKIEKVVFADGYAWTAADVESGQTLTGSGTLAGAQYADTLTATAYGTQLNGGAGNDQLVAQVDGAIFNVTFNGGAGDDFMTGSYGGDVYKFNLGDSHDTIRDDVRANGQGPADYFAATPGDPGYQDRIEFGAGITAQGVSRSRIGNDMVLGLNGGNDSIRIRNWFDGTVFNKIEGVVFADGTQWTAAQMEQNINVVGTAAADSLVGSQGADVLDGLAGDDMLAGGAGGDTYTFTRGDGHDTVVEDDAAAATDVAWFDGGIASSQLWFQRIGDNLEVKVIGTTDAMTVTDWYVGSSHQVEHFKVDGNLTLLASDVQNLVQAMASFAPPAAGQTTLPQNYQDSLNSVIAANWH